MRSYILWGLTALFVVLIYACSKERIESSEKELLNFSIGDFKQNAEGTVDPQTKTVTLQAIGGVDITKLVPMIKVSDKATISPASGIAQDFTKPVTYTITAEDGSKQTFTITVIPAKSSLKEITCFKFLKIKPEVIATIDQEKKTINLKVPYGTNIKELVPTINLSDKSTVLPANEEKQDFTKPVVYTVTAEDGSKQEYTVTVEVGKRSEKMITEFKLTKLNPAVAGTINEEAKTVSLEVPAGTDVTTLVPTLTLSTAAAVSPATDVKQDFTKPVVYTVTAEDGSKQEYTVTVAIAKRTDKKITEFKLAGLTPAVTAKVDEEAKTISLVVPAGTDVTTLVPTLTLSEGAQVSPASDLKQDFTKPVVYTVTAEDGTKQEYTVTVAIAKKSDKKITEFKLAGLNPAVTAKVDEEAKAISLAVPAGTDVTTLVPTLTLSEGAQVSPTSDVKQDFTKPVVYTVTAEDGSKQEYTVTVEVGKKSDKKITEFKLSSLNASGTINEEEKTVTLLLPTGTNITALAPTIVLSDGATVNPASDVKQDFTNPVTYTVTAQDGSIQKYIVTAKLDTRKSSANKITEFKFASLKPVSIGKIDETSRTISLAVPLNTDVSALVPTITLSEGAQISPALDTKQDFSKPVIYTVTAEDGSKQEYTVTVEVAKRSDKKITEFKLAGLNPVVTAKIDERVKTITLVVPAGTDVTALVPSITLSEGAKVSPASDVKQNFTKPVEYTVTAVDGSEQDYTVTVEVTKKSDKKITDFKFGSLNANGTINEEQKTISFQFPAGTNVTAIAPTIALSDGATVSPASDVKQDFTTPITYTVTAQDGSTQKYVVTVKVEIRKRSENRITEFKFASLTPITVGKIDETNKSISLTVPMGTDVSALTPTITISEGAQVSPALNTKQDFTKPVTYTVTAEDGSTRTYTVVVKAPTGKEKDILSFQFTNLSTNVDLDQNGRRIKVTLIPGTKITSLAPTIAISEGAKVSPASGVVQNFEKPVVYTVTAADGSTSRYVVSVEVEFGTKNEITAFTFEGVIPAVHATIDLEKHTITALLPKKTNLSSLKPTITISPAAEISPASGVAQDFSKPVSYSVMSESGALQVYTVTAAFQKSEEKIIKEFSFHDDFQFPKVSIDDKEHLIKIKVTPRVDITKIKPRITVSEDATVSPASDVQQDFSKPVVYTVTAEDGSKQDYTVMITDVIKSSEKKIDRFYFTTGEFWPSAQIDEASHSLTIELPTDTDLSYLAPKISISSYAQISPKSGESQDFTKPVVYTITAQDGSTQEYTVYASRKKYTEKEIKEFKFTSLQPEVLGRINTSDNKITFVVKPGTDVTALTPTITLSKWAKVKPMSGLPQDFSKPIVYTVTAEDGTTKAYTVSIISDENKILSYKFTSFTPEVVGVIDEQNATIKAIVPWNTNPKTLKPEITISPKAQIRAVESENIIFGYPNEYVVTAEDGSWVTYKAYVSRAFNEEAKISEFKFKNTKFVGAIDQENKRITLHVPYGTNLKNQTQEIKFSEKATITPALNDAVDYSSPVTFTVIAESGTKVSYTVQVIVDKFETKISSVSKTKVELEDLVTIKGNFYPDGLKVLLEGERTIIPLIRESSSSSITIYIPSSTPFGEYKLTVISGESKATNYESIRVNKFAKYPTIRSLASDKVNPGGYLKIYGTNFKQDGFTTEVRIGDYTPIKDLTINSAGTELKVPIPSNMPLGSVYLNVVCGESSSSRYQIEVVSTAPSPFISKVSTTNITAGDDITISGSYFANKNNRVWFENENGGTYSCEIISEDTDEIKIKTHNLPEGSRYTLFVGNGNLKSSYSERLSIKLGAIKITSVSPRVLGKDEIITVEGEYIYQRSYEVEIGGKMCPTSYKDSKSFSVYLPYNISSGTYDLKITAISADGKRMGSIYSSTVKIK